MGGKKGDTKPAKKGGGKESAASSKPAPKKDEKKGGKGKEKDDKKKGKDAKKAKKEVTSDSEEASEAELIKQASEESKNEEEEEDESEVDARRRRGREKGVVALKGASKAMAGMNQGNRRKGQPVAKEETKPKEGALRKDISRAQLKGATKAMAGLAKKPAQPPTKKKSLKATSRLFMKFRQMNPRRSKKGHFKAASKLLTGFRKKLVPSSLLNKKKKSVAMLKNTSKLMLGLRKSLKKQPPKPQPSDGTKQKPTFMLLRLGGNSSKTDQKGPGGLLSGLFGRKKAKNKFQPKAKVLTKVSAAASWLTKKFLSKKRGFSENDKAIQEAWLSRMGAQKLPFPTQDEFRRYQANLQRFPGVHRFHGQNEDVYGNPKNFEAYHQRFPTQSYTPQGPGRYDDPSMEYYDYGNEDYGYDDQGYLGNENRFPYGYDSYPGEELGYDDYPEYQMDEDYPSYEENMEYYGEDSHLLRSQNSRFDYQVDVHNPPNTYSGYDFEENEMGYYEDAMNPYGTMENGRNPFLSFSDQSNYSDFNDVDEYISTNATPNYRDYPVSPYAEPLNPYAQPMDDVMETDEAMVGRDVNYYEDQDMEEETPSTLSINRKYKLFPRPQVKLFGREKLDVPLPPSPHISFTDYDEEEEEEEEDEPLIPPARQQRNFRQPPNKSLFAKSVQRNYGQPCARGVQNVLFAKPVGKRFSGYHQENCQENESLDFSPRAFGSPLGQFMKETLNPKPILKHSGTRRNTQPPSEPPYRNAFAESNVPRTPSPQPSLKLFKGPLMQGGYQEQNTPSAQQNWSQRNTQLPSQPPNRNAFVESNVPQTSSPRPSLKYMKGPVNHVGFQKQNAPSAQQLENLQNNLEHEPYHKRFGLKLAGMDSSNVSRKPTFSASNNNNTEAKPSPQPTRQSPQPVQKFYNHGKNPAGKPQSMGREEQNEEHGFHDMTQLEDLQEASVLDNLRKRFDREIIYTYIGSILLSMNPYKMLNLYGTDHVLKYEGKALGENPPHLFAIANVAYTKLMDAKNNQCIIISGESGSGKTEATKLVLQYLVAINQRRGVKNKILEATPLLESFGNAKTVRNDNSSRFGKFIEIYLEEGVICGAITSQYLLEKSRIVFQANNERNYHIFYEMLAGLPSQQKQMFYLQDAETYYYLNQGCNCDIPAKSDADDFRRLLNAMESLSFTGEEQDSIFRILSSILHLGNVYFEKHETESQEIASVVSASEIRAVSELLQISPEGLQKAITYKVTETMREKILTPLTVESAVDARDAIAKILYSLLFSWLTERINKLVYPKQDALSIAILDIFGFEDLSFNSFEQLCINYANEYLQFFFNKIIFREEQEEYIREQIDWREISFSDNQACIDIISQKPHGILRILDDQSGFPQATDHTFLQKCHYQHGTSDLYCKPKMPLPEFGIKHFAGKVTYQVHQFLDKNYDQVRQDVLDLFVNSKIKVVANLFFSHAQVLAQQKTMMGKGNTVTRKYKASTVAAKFQQSLLELVEKMERCNPFFVRCMKPNSRKEPNLFEADIVTSQLKYSGILETIRIRKEGFPVRMSFSFFLSRYRCVMDLGRNVRIDGQTCVTALKKLCPSATPSMYCIGVSKLFMKEKVYQLLESQRDQFMNKFAVTLQRYSRGYLTRKRFYILRYRIIQLQALARGYLARRKFYNWRKIMTMFRAVVRIYVNRRKFLRMKAEARRIEEEEHKKAERELTKREVVNVTHLELPAELAGLLRSTTATKNLTLDFVLPIQSPRVEADTQLTLPLDINNYLMFKYVRVFFKEPLFGMLTVPHGSSLLPVEDDLRQHAISSFKLILRFMGDPYLGGTQEILFGNYIVQKGLSNIGLRDEILAQVANQVWRNSNPNNEERGWYLLACCLSTFAPSPNLDKYLLKYVSDYAHDGYKPVCQHKLIQAIQKSQQGSETSRNFPPSQLEWTASRERANMAMDVHFFDGEKISCPIHSWTDGEEIAGDVLRHRGVKEGYRGWSVSLKEGGQWTELAGQDYVLDLICNMELPRDFPKQKSYFITTSETIQENISHPSAVFGNSGEAGESVPPPSTAKAPSVPRQDSEGYHNDSDSVSEPQSQKGMDNYLDSLFDPVLSYGNGDLEKLTALSQKMKGGGGVGGRDGREVPRDSNFSGDEPYSAGLDAQQQAYINQQAILLAQQMTMQAMAIQQQMVNNRSAEMINRPRLRMTAQPVRSNSQRVTPTVAPMPRTGAPFQRKVVYGTPSRIQRSPARESSQRRPVWAGPSNPHHPDDLIQHSAMNSEHHPESSHNKNILNRYKQPGAIRQPGPVVRKQPEHFFGRIIDPHEEALNMLNRQRPTHLLTRPTPVSNMSYVPKAPRDTVAFVKPVPSIKTKTPVAKPPVSHVRPTTAPTVTVNRELSEEQENIQTQLHRQYSEEYYTYTNVLWRIYIRKEVFYPRDSFNNPLTLDLIFKQIINDTLTENCIRISKEERQKMRSLLAGFRLDSINAIADESVKKKIVTVAREELEVYFSRLFPAAGSEGTGVQFLGVSHVGIKLLKLLKRSGSTPEQLRVLRSYSYTDIMFVTVLSKNMLEFNLTNEKLVLFSSRSSQVKTMIDCFLTELKKDSNYVVAVQNYVTEDKSFLSFHKGDIIRLQALDGLEKGWKFGAIHSRAGLLPAECVQPVAAPDFVNLPADRKEEPRNRQSRAAASAAVAVAVASTAVAHEFDRKMDGSPTPSEYAESLDEYTDPNTSEIMLQGSPYNMVEFAKKYFREGQRLAAQDKSQKMSGDSSKQGSKKSKEPKDLEEMLKFTKTPIQESLIEFSDGSMNRIAADVFTGIMKFMGDLPLKGQSELDAVYSVLKLCGEHEVMKDEGYCQIMKQITDNTSSNTDSCQRGWRLLFILTAYYKCSEVLKPYLFNFLQDTCRSPGLHYQGIAKACEQNLRKTIQYGGRTEYPSAIELKAMVAGRSSKRQLFLLPGGIERHLKIKTCSVAFDVIEEICMEMGVHKDEAFHEYAIFAVTNRGQNVRPLNRKEYILDVSAEMEQTDSNYMFWFRRIIWAQQLKFENELYVTMHYNQVLPDYLKGLFNVVAHIKPTEQQFQQISRLAALQHRAKDSVYLPTAREVQDYIPSQFYKVLKPQSWLNMVMQHMQQIQPLSPHQGRAQFLGIVSDFPMFGSSFFYIQSCSNNTVIAPCILAVNQNGLNFLNKETHELVVTFPLSNIQSTRTQRPASGFSYPYVDVMLGDVMSQRVTQLQLEQGLELCRVVATHMENLLQSRDKHLTLPPSDITLL
ncbi:unconventional myosin-XV-like [Xenopus laevis]|uniref:Unconventional myosin-XV-like n=1 Tax=Xenopus laevis TaxID=8355 RepID=A0A8J1LX17_XENLA|nr:unconventional myosin-XV-like [Xenopus laevis]